MGRLHGGIMLGAIGTGGPCGYAAVEDRLVVDIGGGAQEEPFQ